MREKNPGFDADDETADVPDKFRSRRSQSKQSVSMRADMNKGDDHADYIIKGFDKSPLSKNEYGLLQPAFQNLFGLHLAQDIQDGKAMNPKKFEKSSLRFLRFGVEHSRKKSFVAALATVFAHMVNNGIPVTVNQMLRRIAESFTLDDFAAFNNGNLVKLFLADSAPLTAADRAIHKTTALASLHGNGSAYLDRIIRAHRNFVNYLIDPDELVTHEYLWDIVSRPNPKLFPAGILPAIFERANADQTDNVRFICSSGTGNPWRCTAPGSPRTISGTFSTQTRCGPSGTSR
jgi:hypothetical protein